MGAPPDVIEQARNAAERARPRAKPPAIWGDNAKAWEFFLRLEFQWNYVSGLTTRRAGIPFERVLACFELYRVPPRRRSALLEDLTMMVRAVLKVDDELAAKKASSAAAS